MYTRMYITTTTDVQTGRSLPGHLHGRLGVYQGMGNCVFYVKGVLNIIDG